MYQAYDSWRWQPAPDHRPQCCPLDVSQLDPRALVHPLVLCPPVPDAIRYLLVQRRTGGQRVVLGFGRTQSAHSTLNLAQIRHQGARLGATEVFLLPA